MASILEGSTGGWLGINERCIGLEIKSSLYYLTSSINKTDTYYTLIRMLGYSYIPLNYGDYALRAVPRRRSRPCNRYVYVDSTGQPVGSYFSYYYEPAPYVRCERAGGDKPRGHEYDEFVRGYVRPSYDYIMPIAEDRLEGYFLHNHSGERKRYAKHRREHERREQERREQERREQERREQERREQERVEQERLEKERAEKALLEFRNEILLSLFGIQPVKNFSSGNSGTRESESKVPENEDQKERERSDAERLEKVSLENERLEKERKEKLEKGRLEKERLEKERLEKERLEKERKEKLEKERLEKERLEKERLEKERLEKERLEKERKEKERKEKERKEKERKEKERKEKLEKERLEKERLENERLEKERLEKERLEKERKEKLEKERLEKERLEKERLEKERLEKEDFNNQLQTNLDALDIDSKIQLMDLIFNSLKDNEVLADPTNIKTLKEDLLKRFSSLNNSKDEQNEEPNYQDSDVESISSEELCSTPSSQTSILEEIRKHPSIEDVEDEELTLFKKRVAI